MTSITTSSFIHQSHQLTNPYKIIGCTCDCKENSRVENIRECIHPSGHTCICEPEPFNFSNTQCRADRHKCVCHVINRWSLGGTNYDHGGIGFVGDTFDRCQANDHRCFCHLGYQGGCPSHPNDVAIGLSGDVSSTTG